MPRSGRRNPVQRAVDRLPGRLRPLRHSPHRVRLLRHAARGLAEMQAVGAFLVKYPELAVYLTISVGYLIGRINVGGISFGPVTGSLFAGLLIGQVADIPIAGMAKSILFVLFLFGIGYSVGPQFMQSLKRDGL